MYVDKLIFESITIGCLLSKIYIKSLFIEFLNHENIIPCVLPKVKRVII